MMLPILVSGFLLIISLNSHHKSLNIHSYKMDESKNAMLSPENTIV
jgi:hypothetical protein